MRKEPRSTLHSQRKVPVIDRISELVRRHPSRSAAARTWGININTLNSYYKNELSPPIPRDNLLARIAESEGVSLEWLKNGEMESPKTPISSDGLSELLSFLTDEERHQLTMVLTRKGVETILYLLDENNLLLLQQPDTLKAHMIQEYITGTHQEREATTASTTNKVCARANEEQATSKSLTTTRPRKAG